MFSLKKTKEVYLSPQLNISDVDLEWNCLLTGSDVLLNIQADELENKNLPGEDGLGRGTATYLEF